MSVNDELLNRAIRHAVYLEQIKGREISRMIEFMDKRLVPDMEKVLAQRLSGISKDGGGMHTKRFQSLMSEMKQVLKANIGEMRSIQSDRLLKIGNLEARWQAGILGQTVPLDITFRTPTITTIRSALTSEPMQGRLLSKWYSDLSSRTATNISDQLTIGFLQGESIERLTSRIIGTRGAKTAFHGADSVTQMRRHVRTITRTSTNHIANHAREATYAENADVIKSVRYVATLDARTTDICMSLDGQVFPIMEGIRPPAHHQCRSTTVPITKSWKELGIKNAKDKRVGGRAFRDVKTGLTGTLPKDLTYGQWLKKQSPEFQNQVLGVARGRALRDGRMTFERFFDNGRRMSIAELAEEEGIDIGKRPPKKPKSFTLEQWDALSDSEQQIAGLAGELKETILKNPSSDNDPYGLLPNNWNEMTVKEQEEWLKKANTRTDAVLADKQQLAIRSLAKDDDDDDDADELDFEKMPFAETFDTQRNEDGTWLPEREFLHEIIAEEHLKDGVERREGEEMHFHVMGGGSGAGKSYSVRSGNIVLPDNNIMLDSDHIKSLLPEWAEGLREGSTTIAGEVHEESSWLMKQIQAEGAKRKYNMTLDGTGDGTLEKLTRKMQAMRDQGYTISADYVTVDTATAVQRNVLRYIQTGRYVQDQIVSGTHRQVSRILEPAIKDGLFDDLRLWDTNGREPRLIAEYQDGKLEIYDDFLWRRFLRKGDG